MSDFPGAPERSTADEHPQAPRRRDGLAGESQARLFRWQVLTAATLFLGYFGYYICRSHFSVVSPLLVESLPALGKIALGKIASLGVICYALGKLINGPLADYLGGRRLFLWGMLGSILCTLLLTAGSSFAWFALFWSLNRYVQSAGWVAIVRTTGHWFSYRRQALVMAIISTSYLLGDAFAKTTLGWLVLQGATWQQVFFWAAGGLATILALACLTLRASPRDLGMPEPEVHPENVYGRRGESPLDRPQYAQLLGPLLRSLDFWLICGMSCGLTIIRETFNFWTPLFLKEVVGVSAGTAAMQSAFFPAVGAVSCILAGYLSHRFNSRHDRVILPSVLLLTALLFVLAFVPLRGRLALAQAVLGGIAFMLIAPYSFLAGVIALDLGARRGAASTAGMIDSAGYLGSVFSGIAIGSLAQNWGWTAAFLTLAACGLLTSGAAGWYWLRRRHRRPHPVPS